VANTGTKDDARIEPANCDHGHYKVVQRFDATGDTDKCKGIQGATDVYYYRTTPDSLSFVLCLQAL
jgi:hypothetical protein